MRRERRKRLRKSQSQQDCGNIADTGANAQPTVWPSVRQTVDAYTTRPTLPRSNGPSNRATGRNKPLLVGCKQSPVAGQHHPKAAKSWTNCIEKVVYCVDNVSSLTSAEDPTNFVSGLDVKVTSCFEVKNRRPAWQRRNDSVWTQDISPLCRQKRQRETTAASVVASQHRHFPMVPSKIEGSSRKRSPRQYNQVHHRAAAPRQGDG